MANQGKIRYKNVTETTDISKISLLNRQELYNEFKDAVYTSTSKEKKEHRNIIKSMLDTIEELVQRVKKRDEEIKSLKKKKDQSSQEANIPPNDTANIRSNKFNSYADCVKSKEKVYQIIVKKKIEEANVNVKKIVFEKLKSIKEQLDIKVHDIRDGLIIKAANEQQQDLILDQMKSTSTIECFKPKRIIPSILIKDIQRIESEDNSPVNYECYIEREISESLKISEEEFNVKVIINKPNFRSVRAVVNLNEDQTKKVFKTNRIRVGYSSCNIERSYNIIQCKRCYKYGHHELSKDKSTLTCKNDRVCPLCSNGHTKDQECQQK